MKRLLLILILFAPLLLRADPTAVTAVEVTEGTDETTFIIELSRNTELKPSMLGESVVVNLPDDVLWHAPTSLEDPTGYVKNFSIESGELVIHLEPETAMKEVLYTEVKGIPEVVLTFVKGNPHQAYDIMRHTEQHETFDTPIAPDGSIVQNIRIGLHGEDKTRLVLDMSTPADIKAEQQGARLTLHLPKHVQLATDGADPAGHIEGMSIEPQEDGSSKIHLDLAPGATLDKSFSMQGGDDAASPKFVVDISLKQKIVLNTPAIKIAATTDASDAVPVPPIKPILAPTIVLKRADDATEQTAPTEQSGAAAQVMPLSAAQQPQAITSLTMDLSDGVTRVIIGTVKPEHFHVVENEYIHQVLIRLPKTDWDDVAIHDDELTMVKSYFVDQSHPKWTTLVLTLYDHVTVVDREVIYTYHKNPAFVLAISEPGHAKLHWGKNTVYHWGKNIKIPQNATVTLEDGSKPLQQNEEKTVIQKNPFAFETEKPEYSPGDEFEGGTTPFTSLGTGPYIGAQVSYATGRNKVRSTTGANNSFKTTESMNGFNVGGYAGYGVGFGRFMAGAEAFLHLAYQGGSNSVVTAPGAPALVYKNQSSYGYGLALRLGAYVAPEAMLSVRLGVVGTVINHKIAAGGTGIYGISKNIKQNMAGILYGFGIESALDNHLSVRIDFNHIDYQHFTKTFMIAGQQQTGRMATKMEQIMLGVTYKFRDMFGPNSDQGRGVIPTGFYVGTGLDMSSMAYNRHFSGAAGNSYSMKSSSLTPMWMMHLGYGVQHGKYYYGAEIEASLGTRILRENFTQNGVAESYMLQMQPSVGLYLRPGIAFGHGNLLYAKLGVVTSYLKRTGTSNNATAKFTGGERFGKNMVGVAAGIGLEAFANENLSFRGEYMFEAYRKISIARNNIVEKFSPTNSKFQFAVNYLI